jgi:hypothetical protein
LPALAVGDSKNRPALSVGNVDVSNECGPQSKTFITINIRTPSSLASQQGDYEGLAAHGGIAHPIWTDSRRNTENATPSCAAGRGLMEEVFTATVK